MFGSYLGIEVIVFRFQLDGGGRRSIFGKVIDVDDDLETGAAVEVSVGSDMDGVATVMDTAPCVGVGGVRCRVVGAHT